MKVYLSDHYPRDSLSNKGETDRNRTKNNKNNKNKELKSIPQTQFSSKMSNIQSSVVNRSRSTKRQQSQHQQITVKVFKQHTQVPNNKSEEVKLENSLNKTYSKKRLKTEASNYHAETIRVIKKEAKAMESEDNFVGSIVRDRFNPDKRRKAQESASIKRIINLTQLAKDKKRKNPQDGEGNEGRSSCKEVESVFLKLHGELQREELSMREEALCQLIGAVMKRMRQLEVSDESQRLVRVVRELQQRNVRLMSLVNHMKRKGVDVDLYWQGSSLP